ncbi:DUF6526 family protein [Bacillus sp. FJAT-42315]|uniref:DUF6526 family protein n=1 Tax=Bacillus sp. FJAT-42315 TaxID=2014077 RepID=UPI000C233558|nr:DUF6526 family protein [Bacillus sp. FJAT-42315]
MKKQSYENHTRYNPLQHFIWLPLAIITLISAGVYTFSSVKNEEFSLNTFLILALAILSAIAGILARMYGLALQDRLIRTEEQFRYYILTNKRLDPRLTVPQLIALRFASDEEYPALADKAAQKQMAPNEIKKAIKNWRADEYRV